MRHLDLFSGIGGFALAASWVWPDHEVVAFCDNDKFAHAVLNKHWPDVPIIDDVRKITRETIHGTVDLISGGFPCQPFSQAGKREGENDDRYLWPEMLRIIIEIKPRWVLGENVDGLFTIANGVVFERVCADLESAGYEVWPIRIPACATGAPHRRDRWWFLAHTTSVGRSAGGSDVEGRLLLPNGEWYDPQSEQERDRWDRWITAHDSEPATDTADAEGSGRGGRGRTLGDDDHQREIRTHVGEYEDEVRSEVELRHTRDGEPPADADDDGQYGCDSTDEVDADTPGFDALDDIAAYAGGELAAGTRYPEGAGRTSSEDGQGQAQHGRTDQWSRHWLEVASEFCRVDDGVPARVDGRRKERLKALGNAIVPQVAYQIMRAMKHADDYTSGDTRNQTTGDV